MYERFYAPGMDARSKTDTLIHLYIADVSPLMNDDLYERVYRSVSCARRQKTDRMRFRKDKMLSLGGEYLLMHACENAGLDYGNLEIQCESGGKPDFADPSFHFNISHSGERALCAFSTHVVGCDIQIIRESAMGIASRFFTEEECRLLEKQKTEAEKAECFCRLWTLKESFMKCTGLGFSLPLNAFSAIPAGNTVSLRQTVDREKYAFYEHADGDSYRCACCVKNAGEDAPAEWEYVTIG